MLLGNMDPPHPPLLPSSAAHPPETSEEFNRRALDDLIGRNIRETARSRWLTNEEVFDLLHNFRAYGIHESTSIVQNPPSKNLLKFPSAPLS
jgi:SUMO ligase MMS21 Smc5/6 complex component